MPPSTSSLLDLKRRRGEVLDELQSIAKASQLGGRGFTADERKRIAALRTEDEQIKEELAAKEQESGDRAYIEGLSKELGQSDGRKTKPPSAGHAPSNECDPKAGFKNPREFMLSVMRSGRGLGDDPRLKALRPPALPEGLLDREMLAAGSDEATGINDPYGGFLVPEGFLPNFMMVQPEDDPFAGRTMNLPMSNPIVRIPARTDKNHTTSVSGGLTVTRKPETVAATSSRMTMEQVVMQAHGLFGLSYATEEILTDSPITFAALLAASFSEQFTAQLIFERINGTGVGEFEGILNSPALVSISKEVGQAATTLLYENVLKMRARCWGYANAIWLANHDTTPQLMQLNQAVGLGGAVVWQPSAREDRPDMLVGRPIYFTEYVPTLGTVGDLILVNPTQYLEGTYQPMQAAESIHVRFVNHERAFKFWVRNDGRGWWKSALTPQNGSNTLSPFVVVATRS